jgi:hypothetical protein
MTRLSSKMTFFYKRVFPALFIVVLLFVTLTPVVAGHGDASPIPFFVVPAVMAVIFYTVMKKLCFDLVDEVWDDGDALIVRNGTTQERIPLSGIKNVSYTHLINPPRVTLSLRQPGNLGSELSFCAPVQLMPFAKSQNILELIDRIDAARRR